MPNKHNTDRRHHIPKMKFKVQNWPEYEAGLRRRGSLTLWIEDAALAQWQSVGPRGQVRYQGVAIETYLMLRATFKMALRQTEGSIASSSPKPSKEPSGLTCTARNRATSALASERERTELKPNFR